MSKLSRRAAVARTSTEAGWERSAEHEWIERESNLAGFPILPSEFSLNEAGSVRCVPSLLKSMRNPPSKAMSPALTEAQVYLTHAASYASLLILPLIPTSNYWGFLSCM